MVEATGLAPRQLDLLWDALGASFDDVNGRRRREVSIPTDAVASLRVGFDDRRRRLESRADAGALRARLGPLIASLPAAKADFDQVPATVDTLVARVQHLDRTWDLHNCNILFLGDHDGTSVALAAMLPDVCDLSVVDADHDLLARLRAVFAGLRADNLAVDPVDIGPIRSAAFADLRIGLPAPAQQASDLVVTDPPYTPDGVGLFLRAARHALKPGTSSRIVLHYGASVLTPGLIRGVQQEILNAGLVVEELLRGFSRYRGAYAIGARSDLYVLRPVGSALSSSPPSTWAIYSHGSQAKESACAEEPTSPSTLSGQQIAALLDAPDATDFPPEPALTRRHGHLLVQVLMAARGRPHSLTCDNDSAGLRNAVEQRDLRDAISGQYDLAQIERSVDGGRLTRLRLLRRASTERTPWSTVSMRPHSRLTSSIADALIGWQEPAGVVLTKRTAKVVAQQIGSDLGLGAYRLVDLETSCILSVRSRLAVFRRDLPPG